MRRATPPAPPSLAACALALAGVSLSLRVAGFARTIRLLDRLAPPQRTATVAREAPPPTLLRAAADAVALTGSFVPWRALCLEQSLTLCLLLRRRGAAATLRLGVRSYPFAAHAWVECGGLPVNDDREHLGQFVSFPELPA